ncbi:MAG: hypothetical protein ABW128_17935 [Rhizorhabdus sp.]
MSSSTRPLPITDDTTSSAPGSPPGEGCLQRFEVVAIVQHRREAGDRRDPGCERAGLGVGQQDVPHRRDVAPDEESESVVELIDGEQGRHVDAQLAVFRSEDLEAVATGQPLHGLRQPLRRVRHFDGERLRLRRGDVELVAPQRYRGRVVLAQLAHAGVVVCGALGL